MYINDVHVIRNTAIYADDTTFYSKCVEIPRYYIDLNVNSFFPHTATLQNFLYEKYIS